MSVGLLLRGVAEHLHTEGVGVYREHGTYTPSETGIYLRRVPPAPDSAITIASYDVEDTRLPAVTYSLQIRYRAPAGAEHADTVDELAEDVFWVLHGAKHRVWAGVEIADVTRVSAVPLGVDENGRPERADNYRIVSQNRRNSR